jgi:RNA polymerase sigma factor (sigma-70 family)
LDCRPVKLAGNEPGNFIVVDIVTGGSVTEWILGLKAGEATAAQKLWERYRDQLMAHARKRVPHSATRAADEEDVLQSVFICLCRGAAVGRFNDVRDRDDLWWLLVSITKHKSVDLVRRESAQKRGAGEVVSECGLGLHKYDQRPLTLDDLIADEPTPEFIAMMEEENRRLLNLLRDDELRKIAISRIEGYSIAEIADQQKISIRSVERKLRLIRNLWRRELTHATECSAG